MAQYLQCPREVCHAAFGHVGVNIICEIMNKLLFDWCIMLLTVGILFRNETEYYNWTDCNCKLKIIWVEQYDTALSQPKIIERVNESIQQVM